MELDKMEFDSSPIQFYDSDLELVKNCYINGDITKEELKTSFLRNQITIIEFAKIIHEKDIITNIHI